jgi:hypothetical protein
MHNSFFVKVRILDLQVILKWFITLHFITKHIVNLQYILTKIYKGKNVRTLRDVRKILMNNYAYKKSMGNFF